LRRWHPDKNPDAPGWVAQKLTHAKAVLSDAERRQRYDRGEDVQTGGERGQQVDLYDVTPLEEAIDDFFVPDQPTSENEVYYCNIHGVYYPHPGGFQFTYIPNRSVENMYCLGLPDRTKDCTTAFWGNEEMRRTPCPEHYVHLHFDRIFKAWWTNNEPRFRVASHPLLGNRSPGAEAPGQQLALTALMMDATDLVVAQSTELDAVSHTFRLTCLREQQRIQDKFEIPPENLTSVSRRLHWEAVLKCAILRRELLLEDKRFEVDVWIPRTEKECKTIAREREYRRLRNYQIELGSRKLQQLLGGLDKHAYVEQESAEKARGFFRRKDADEPDPVDSAMERTVNKLESEKKRGKQFFFFPNINSDDTPAVKIGQTYGKLVANYLAR
jgi:hypothetical protein